MNDKNYNTVDVLIVGAGPAGLSTAIGLKKDFPDLDIAVIDKELELGNHNLSGAVIEPKSLHDLLDQIVPDWNQRKDAIDLFSKRVARDDLMFMPCKYTSIKISPLIKIARLMGLSIGNMSHQGDYILSISKLSKWLGLIAREMNIDVITGFTADEMLFDEKGNAIGVKLVDQGRNRDGKKERNFVEGERVFAKFIVLAEGCDGLVTEKFIEKAHLTRKATQLYSLGVKELIKVKPEQYKQFGNDRVVHAMGFPIWTPLIGPNMFGGGLIYPGDGDYIVVGMIVGLDWKYFDFNPQDALHNFKKHKFVKRFIDGGEVVEAGAKMIPEGGYLAIPRSDDGSIGRNNVILLGDSAGFVNMIKIKGLHLAINSGILAAKAISQNLQNPLNTAKRYTELIEGSDVGKEMRSAENFRQTIAKFKPTFGLPLSSIAGLLPRFKIEPDYKVISERKYLFKPSRQFDKDTFIAVAATDHREDQPCHLKIADSKICTEKCTPKFLRPCITFCPAGVYETVQGVVKAANPSNCLHCKTCEKKCPFDNIRWTAPEGGGGPRYTRM